MWIGRNRRGLGRRAPQYCELEAVESYPSLVDITSTDRSGHSLRFLRSRLQFWGSPIRAHGYTGVRDPRKRAVIGWKRSLNSSANVSLLVASYLSRTFRGRRYTNESRKINQNTHRIKKKSLRCGVLQSLSRRSSRTASSSNSAADLSVREIWLRQLDYPAAPALRFPSASLRCFAIAVATKQSNCVLIQLCGRSLRWRDLAPAVGLSGCAGSAVSLRFAAVFCNRCRDEAVELRSHPTLRPISPLERFGSGSWIRTMLGKVAFLLFN